MALESKTSQNRSTTNVGLISQYESRTRASYGNTRRSHRFDTWFNEKLGLYPDFVKFFQNIAFNLVPFIYLYWDPCLWNVVFNV